MWEGERKEREGDIGELASPSPPLHIPQDSVRKWVFPLPQHRVLGGAELQVHTLLHDSEFT